MPSELSETWSPPWAPHVVGRFEPRVYDAEEHRYEPQRVEIECVSCGARHRTECASGNVRQRVQVFARVHLHRDPLAPKEKIS